MAHRNQRGASESDEDMALSAREQRALARNVRQLNDTMDQNTGEVNRALRALQGQMAQQAVNLRTEMNPIPGLAPSIARELEPFHGRLGKLFTDWCDRFVIVCEAQSWNNARRCNVLPAFLRGAALQAWRGLPDRDKQDFDRLRRRLIEILQPAYATRFIQNEFVSRKQRPDESVVEFAFELERLVKAGYPNMPDAARGEFLLSNFIDKLSPQVRSLVMIWDPQTFEEARTKAQQVEATQKYTQNSVAVNMLSNPLYSASNVAHLCEMGSANQNSPSPKQEVEKDSSVLFEMGKITEKLERIMNQNSRADSASFQERRQEPFPPRSFSSDGPRFGGAAPNYQRNQQRPSTPPYVERNTFTRNARPTCWRCGKIGHTSPVCRVPRQQPQAPFRPYNDQNRSPPPNVLPQPQQYQRFSRPERSPGQLPNSSGPGGQMNLLGPGNQWPTNWAQISNLQCQPSCLVSGHMNAQPATPLPAWSQQSGQANLRGAAQQPSTMWSPTVASQFLPVHSVSGYANLPATQHQVATSHIERPDLAAENHALRTENARLAARILPPPPVETDGRPVVANHVLACGHDFRDWYSLSDQCHASVVCPNEHVVLYRDVCISIDCSVEFCGTCQHQKGCPRCRTGSFEPPMPITPTPMDQFDHAESDFWPPPPADIGVAVEQVEQVEQDVHDDSSDVAVCASDDFAPHFRHSTESHFVPPAVVSLSFPSELQPSTEEYLFPASECQPGTEEHRRLPAESTWEDQEDVQFAQRSIVPRAPEVSATSTSLALPPEVGANEIACSNTELLARVNEGLWNDQLADSEVAQLGLAERFQPIQLDPVTQFRANVSEFLVPSEQNSLLTRGFGDVRPPCPIQQPLAVEGLPSADHRPLPEGSIDRVLAQVDTALYGPDGTLKVPHNFRGTAAVCMQKLVKAKGKKRRRVQCRDTEGDLGGPSRPRDEDEDSDHDGQQRPRARAAMPRLLPYYAAFIACLLPVVTSTGTAQLAVPNPLVCHASDARTTWRLPDTITCAPNVQDEVSQPQRALLALYKRNYVQYKVSAWLCKKSDPNCVCEKLGFQ